VISYPFIHFPVSSFKSYYEELPRRLSVICLASLSLYLALLKRDAMFLSKFRRAIFYFFFIVYFRNNHKTQPWQIQSVQLDQTIFFQFFSFL